MGDQVIPKVLKEGSFTDAQLNELEKSGYRLADTYQAQLEELFEIRNPSERGPEAKTRFVQERSAPDARLRGNWVVYEWLRTAVHLLPEEEFYALRTNRNQALLTTEELSALSSYTVGVAGLSVGNSIARSLNASAVCGRLVLADHDSFALSNMNRVAIGVADLGSSKLDVTLRQIYESNPYAKIKSLPEGINQRNLDSFFDADRFIAIDEIDDFEMKVRLRLAAKQKKAPVIMMTNLGDNTLIDVERYDQDQSVKPFNSLADDTVQEILSGRSGAEAMKRYAANLVGIDNVPTRALKSLTLIGRELVGRPQLYGSVAISGGLAAYVVKQIILGRDIKSGRYRLSLGEVTGAGSEDLAPSEERLRLIDLLSGGRE